MWRTGGALALVLGMAVALAWTTKRLSRARGSLAAAMGPGGASPSGVLEVLGRYPLSRGVTLVLLKLEAKVLLVSQSVSRGGASMQTLCEIDRPDQVASILLRASRADRSSIADRFQSLLSSSDRVMESELEAAGARQVFRSASGDTVELASISKPVPLARRAGGEGIVVRREATDESRNPDSSFSSSARLVREPVNSSTLADPATVRGYSSVGASRPLTGAEQLRRRLDSWRDREERES
jgi:flagellar biogenesis protein FliO